MNMVSVKRTLANAIHIFVCLVFCCNDVFFCLNQYTFGGYTQQTKKNIILTISTFRMSARNTRYTNPLLVFPRQLEKAPIV